MVYECTQIMKNLEKDSVLDMLTFNFSQRRSGARQAWRSGVADSCTTYEDNWIGFLKNKDVVGGFQ